MDGELVAINLHSGLYYSSVGIGPTIWQLMEAGRSCSEIAGAISEGSGHPKKQVEADVSDFLERLLAADLIASSDVESGPEQGINVDLAGPYEAPSLVAHDDMEQAFALDPPLRA